MAVKRARQSVESRVIRRRLAQMTEEDYPIKRCAGGCGARINIKSARRYCRNGCISIAESSTHRDLVKRAREANGEWVDVAFSKAYEVDRFLMNNADGRNHFEAHRQSSLTARIRWVAA